MNRAELERCLAAGESLTSEFKQDPLSDAQLVEAAVCLANGDGGVLLIGVTDDGSVVGARPRHGDVTEPARIRALVANRTAPSLGAEVTVVDHPDGQVIALEVPAAAAVIATMDGRYVRRAIDVTGRPQCLPMPPNEVVARASSIGTLDYSALPLRDVALQDLDANELERFRRLSGTGGDGVLADLSDSDLLQALGVQHRDGRLTVAAVLLFGTIDAIAEWVPTHEIAFQVISGLEVRINRIERWPLVRAMEELSNLLAPYNPEDEIEIGLFRVGLPRFTEVAIRELLANALVHRDYALRGQVLMQLEGDELRVSNPGTFPQGITPNNVLVAPPHPRNPLLAEVFKRAGLVDRTGRGVNRVFASQLAAGHPPPDYSRTTNAWVEARLMSGPSDRTLAAFVEQSRRDGRPLGLNDLLLLHEVRQERRVTSSRAAELLQVRPEDARIVLNQLVERGLLEARGERKGRTYHFAAHIYRRLGDQAGYVRTRGFDAIQQEQMVLTYVDHHGSITRSEVADLCQLSSEQASYLLRRMRNRGVLDLEGARRRARYVRARSSKTD